ncbi:hypothetical protein [Mesorhizobium sp.]|uniref:hypothetical protein n=1 Tax=Mesorhizobium sp. TaxID=1871066 RepID=UPI0025E3C9AB|nr:hypothetical protein [Mesorhizobium sp.]
MAAAFASPPVTTAGVCGALASRHFMQATDRAALIGSSTCGVFSAVVAKSQRGSILQPLDIWSRPSTPRRPCGCLPVHPQPVVGTVDVFGVSYSLYGLFAIAAALVIGLAFTFLLKARGSACRRRRLIMNEMLARARHRYCARAARHLHGRHRAGGSGRKCC